MRHFALLLLLAVSYGEAADSSKMTPVTRVVQLLQGLSKTIEQEGKEEEDLYERYVCWAKTVIDTKTATNAEADARITELEERIQDIERNPQTSEEADLTKKLGELKKSDEENEAWWAETKADHEKATEEFTLTLQALKEAIKTLEAATKEKGDAKDGKKDEKKTDLLEVQSSLGFEARVKQSETLSRAVAIGTKFLASGDALFLRRLLTGDVPKKDFKKLNRKSTYQAKYKARSGKIQKLLAKLKQTFQIQFKEAKDKHEEDRTQYNKQKKALKGEIGETETALGDLTEEAGAKALSKGECQKEIKALQDQMKNDKKFIKQVTGELTEMKSEWKSRQTVRQNELAAIAKAIEILSSDDAKDTFSSSFTSQGYLFLQTKEQNTFGKALSVLRTTARVTGDARLALGDDEDWAKKIPDTCGSADAPPKMCQDEEAGSNKLDICLVRCYIKQMLDTLKQEAAADLKTKEKCEDDIMKFSRSAAKSSRSADDNTDKIAQAVAEMAEATQNIAKAEQTIEDAKDERKAAIKLRGEQNKEFEAAKAMDKDASVLVIKARDVLKDFYEDPSGGAKPEGEFIQRQPNVEAGKAPPPPPSTWKDPTYEGKQEENNGIVAILDMINEDILKDMAEAKATEAAQLAAHKAHLKEIAQLITDQDEIIKDQKAARTTAKGDRNTAASNRQGDAKTLEVAMDNLDSVHDDCRYMALNFPTRKANRDVEMDGLRKANAILSGSTFDAPDPNREIKPGDAFLQKHKF